MRAQIGPPFDRYWFDPGYESGDLGPKGPKRGPKSGPKMGQKVAQKVVILGSPGPPNDPFLGAQIPKSLENNVDFTPKFSY